MGVGTLRGGRWAIGVLSSTPRYMHQKKKKKKPQEEEETRGRRPPAMRCRHDRSPLKTTGKARGEEEGGEGGTHEEALRYPPLHPDDAPRGGVARGRETATGRWWWWCSAVARKKTDGVAQGRGTVVPEDSPLPRNERRETRSASLARDQRKGVTAAPSLPLS